MTGETSSNEPEATNRGPWTSTEVATLRTQAHLGADQLATILNRTTWSVRRAAFRLRISLRPTGERRGSVLGETKPGHIPIAIRRRYLDQPALATKTEAEIRQAATDPLPLCPLCARYPVRHPLPVCRACHLDGLVAAHRERQSIEDAQRRLDAIRQARSRANRTNHPTQPEEDQ